MAQTIQLKRSSVPGNVPTTAQLALGEIAVNTYDGKVFIKKDDGVETIVEVTGGGGGGEPGVFQPVKLDAISVVNGQASYTMQVGGVAHDPVSDFAMLVSLNGVIQEPGVAFSTSGSTITFSPALATGDVIDFIVDVGNAVDIGTGASTDTLADVTARGATTTDTITAAGFATPTGTATQFLRADGTAAALSETLDTVTDRGSATTNLITVGGVDVNGTIRELTRTATLSGSSAINATLGTIQHIVLSGNLTFTDSLLNGDAVTFMVEDGSGFTITWPTMEWVGGSAPTLDTDNETVIQVWKINGALYGALIGAISVGAGGAGQPQGLSASLLQISGTNDAWTTQTVDISAYANETVRPVFRFVNTGGGFASDLQLDNIQIGGNTYSFENTGESFQTSNADNEADYTLVSWANVQVQQDARGVWQADSGGTPSSNTGRSDADAGSYYVYIETSSPADATGYTAWLRGPEITLGASPTFQFAEARSGADMGQLDVYLEVI